MEVVLSLLQTKVALELGVLYRIVASPINANLLMVGMHSLEERKGVNLVVLNSCAVLGIFIIIAIIIATAPPKAPARRHRVDKTPI